MWITDERSHEPWEFFLVIQKFKKFIYYFPFLRNLFKNVLQQTEDENQKKKPVNIMQPANEEKRNPWIKTVL